MNTQLIVDQPKKQFLNVMLMEVCSITGVTLEEIYSPARHGYIVDARHLFTFVVMSQTEFKYTYAEIGKFMKRNHATIIHSKAKAEELLEYDKGFQKAFKALNSKFHLILFPMTSQEKLQALALKQTQLEHLKIWLRDHPHNPYHQKVRKDARDLEEEIKGLTDKEQKAA